MFHGGGTRKARAAGRRRIAEADLVSRLALYEKKQAAHEAALAPWMNEPAIRQVNVGEKPDPKQLRRIAREMTEGARILRAAARALEEDADP